jgi:hypothetical protein
MGGKEGEGEGASCRGIHVSRSAAHAVHCSCARRCQSTSRQARFHVKPSRAIRLFVRLWGPAIAYTHGNADRMDGRKDTLRLSLAQARDRSCASS